MSICVSVSRNMNNPQFIIIAGTNGVGKSTFGKKLEAISNIPFIDPDLYYKHKYGGYFEYSHDQILETSQELSSIRKHYFETRKSFAVEKILSNEKEILHLIDQAKQNGFQTTLVYIGTDTLSLSNDRIVKRALEGAHYVKPEIVEYNLQESIRNFSTLSKAVDNIVIYDNSLHRGNFVKLLDSRSNVVKFEADNQPEWSLKLQGENRRSAIDWIREQAESRSTNIVAETTQNNPRRQR